MEYGKTGFPKRLLAGRLGSHSSDYGHPGASYRWYFDAYGLRGFERSMLSFAGIKPIRGSAQLSMLSQSRLLTALQTASFLGSKPMTSLSVS